MNYNNLCYRCFCEKPIQDKPCPKCGYEHTPNALSLNCLPTGTLLNNRYIVGIPLGIGGFGITYKCLDTKIGGICAIKEYFPTNYAQRDNTTKTVSVAEGNLERYNKVLKRFVEEANLLKKLHHKNVITIYDSFFENNTAYYVMEYCDGIDLRKYTKNFTRKLEYDEGMNILYQVMNGLEYIHSKGILHRDIAPDNIYITSNNFVKILDFGSARSEMEQFNRELSVIVKVGYAPLEQYGGRGKQGPYTDIYALGATFYHLFTLKTPMESTQRVAEDTMPPFSRLRPELPNNLKYCIEKAMEITTAKRISSIAEMKNILGLNNVSVRRTGEQPCSEEHEQAHRTPVASIAKRMGAYAIDTFVYGTIYFMFLMIAVNIGLSLELMMILFPVIVTLVNIASELTTATTIGKASLRLFVKNKDGEEVTPSQIIIRNIIKLLGIFVVVFQNNEELLEDRATNSIVCEKE